MHNVEIKASVAVRDLESGVLHFVSKDRGKEIFILILFAGKK